MGKIRDGLTAILTAAVLSCSSDSKSPTQPPVEPPVEPPRQVQIVSSPVTSCNEQGDYSYQVQISPSGARVGYSLGALAPSWLSISQTGLITGVCPEVQSTQSVPLEVKVLDVATSNVLTQPFNLTVNNLFNLYNVSSDATVVTDNTIQFLGPVNFTVGDIIYSNSTPLVRYGILRQITGISADRKSATTVQASLEDVVRDATINTSQQLSPQAVAQFRGLPGVSRISNSPQSQQTTFNISLNNTILYDHDGNESTTEDQIILNGNISFTADFNFNMNISNHRLNSLDYRQNLSDVTDITVGSNYLGLARITEVTLAQYTFAPIIFTAGPVPVIIKPTVDVVAGMNAARANPLSFRVQQDATLSTLLTYRASSGWGGSATFTNNFDFSLPPFIGEWDIKVYATPRFRASLYGVAGPFANIGPYLKLIGNSAGTCNLVGGLEARVGATVEVLSKRLSLFSTSVLDAQRVLADCGTTTPPPSNRPIVYTSDFESLGQNSAIARINPDGTGRAALTSTSVSSNYPVLSNNGSSVAFTRWTDGSGSTMYSNIMVTGINGSGARTITNTNSDFAGAFSPDDSRIVISSRRADNNLELYVVNASDGGNAVRLTNNTASDIASDWHGDWIYFYSSRTGGGDIYKVKSNGDSLTQVITYPGRDDNPSISPDGRYMVFDSDRDGDKEIYKFDLQTGVTIPLTSNTHYDAEPSYLPDGRIIYTSTGPSGSNLHIWIMNGDGSNKTQITNSYRDEQPSG